jgi:glutathione synthase/RimK-type ligase-like ATP-grasp enzyme
MTEAGLSVPEVSLDPRGRGWIAKPYVSMGGRNIFELRRGKDLNPHTHYAQRKINKRREFRAHVFMWAENKVPLIQEKIIGDPDQLCWNKKQGGAFKYPHEPILGRDKLKREGGDLVERISKLSIDACRSLRYDLGGIDLALGKDGELYIFEINSRMGLREQSFIVYKQAFGELRTLNIEEYRNERW